MSPYFLDQTLALGATLSVEFADLQKKKFLTLGLDKLDIITIHRDGRVTVYYRDHEQPFEANVDQSDNLLNLPRYVSA